MKCLSCNTEMVEVYRVETSNCEDGCCPSHQVIYQCPTCKTVVAGER